MHTLHSNTQTKEQKYIELLPQLQALFDGEDDRIANFANCCAALKEVFGFWWVGFYFVKNNQLVLGPFQGPIACTRIDFGKGVCGNSWKTKETIVVDDVSKFDGHIACSSQSKSEIVIPILSNNEVIAVLDIDSENLNCFDEIDKKYLENIVSLLNK